MARVLSSLEEESGRFVPASLLNVLHSNPGRRLLSIEMLSNFFRSIIASSPTNLLPCVYLAINAVIPARYLPSLCFSSLLILAFILL
jgi:hypothetical protein